MDEGTTVRRRPLLAGVRDALTWIGSNGLAVLLAMTTLFGGLWVFAEVADEVVERETRSFDEAVVLALRSPGDRADPLGPPWFEEMARDITAMGGVAVLTLFTASVVGYLLLARRLRTALFTVLVVGGGIALSALLKIGFDRPRPDLVPHGSLVHTASFPSGHSMMSAVVYLTLAALLMGLSIAPRLKAYLLIVAAVFTLLVGASRVYLGVHWPTDVVAGWSLGAAWASLAWLVARWLRRARVVETRDGG